MSRCEMYLLRNRLEELDGRRVAAGGFVRLLALAAVGGTTIGRGWSEAATVAVVAVVILGAVWSVVNYPHHVSRRLGDRPCVLVGYNGPSLERAMRSDFEGRTVAVCRSGDVIVTTWRHTVARVGFAHLRSELVTADRIVAISILGDSSPALIRVVVRDRAEPIYASCDGQRRALARAFGNWSESPWR